MSVIDQALKSNEQYAKAYDPMITGQNPASSGPAAKTLMAVVKQKAKPAATART
jgi:hypothetical protein